MYAILCDYAADKDHCWPSQTTLAKRLSCSISSVKNYLGELVREKLISIRREQYRSSVYYLLRPEEFDQIQETKPASEQSESGCDEANSGYLITLSKQRKERVSPLSPHIPGETAPAPVRRTFKAPAAGGVSVSFSGLFHTAVLSWAGILSRPLRLCEPGTPAVSDAVGIGRHGQG